MGTSTVDRLVSRMAAPRLARPRLGSSGQLAAPAFTLPSRHRRAGAVTGGSAGRPKSGHTGGSGYADVYMHGPCTGRETSA